MHVSSVTWLPVKTFSSFFIYNYRDIMVTLVIQAGGKSRRMGVNKALLSFNGEVLIHRVYRRLLPIADEILVTGGDPGVRAALPVQMIPDMRPNTGALGGIFAALLSATNPLLAVVACDMPFASPKLFLAAIALLESSGADAVVPCSLEGPEPMHAVYRQETCLPAVQRSLMEGNFRIISWFSIVQVRMMTVVEVRNFDPDLLAFTNVNTPDEFQHAERLATLKGE
jgi:molybdopterin-guanine dinucleotide biosynthesis protein A